MALSESNSADAIVARFLLAWEEEDRPLIVDFLSAELEPDDRSEILTRLVAVDVEKRFAIGEKPQSADYMQLGTNAVDVAEKRLHSYESDGDLSLAMSIDSDLIAKTELSDSKTTGANESFETRQTNGAFDETKSTFIGPYKLLQKIGEGGMGAVWMAEQQQPVRRRVALKVIRAEIGSKIAIARFEAERQAIAMMDHQNIARILDAGTTPNGNPFFVMELVHGVPFNKYCDKRRLNIRQRLELMVPVCRAIQHAHQKGIIHRDLKHSNVLVTQYDDKPVPKIIDFGLAKSFEDQHKLTDRTMFTEFGKVVGTLQYMSPEQAEMSGVDVDTRTDIYSLGVMLYKLLTGGTPLDDQTLSSHSFLQVLEIIREKEPLRPSLRVAALDASGLQSHATKLNLRPDKIRQQIQGDIDWIVLKALDKDRTRRYETANGLALDIERYLRNDVVSASPPSSVYRLQKLVNRNRGLFTAAFACTILLVLGLIGTVFGLVSALNERDRANAQTREAVRESERATKAEQESRKAKIMAEARLHAIKIKSAWSDWQLGNVQPALQMLNSLSEDEVGWESQFLNSEFASSKHVLFGHALHVVSIDSSPDGRFIATASDDNTIKVWDGATKMLLQTLMVSDAPTQVCFSPDSKTLACSDLSNRVSFWDVTTGQPARESIGPLNEDVTAISFFDGGKKLLLGTSAEDSRGVGRNKVQINPASPVARIIELSSGETVAELTGHSDKITAVDCSSDGQFILTCGLDATIRVWKEDANEYRVEHTLTSHSPGVLDVAMSPSGELFASCGRDSAVRLWETKSGSLIATLVGHQASVNGIRFSPDGQYLASGSSDRSARIWNLNGEALLVCQGHYQDVYDVSFASHGAEVLTASSDKTARVWDATSNPSTRIVKAHSEVVWQADFSTDGSRVVSASEDGTVCILDTRTGGLACEPIQHDDPMLCITHSPIADLFVSGGVDAKLRVFSSVDGALIKTIDAHEGYLWDASFSQDGKRLATAGADHSVCVWDTEDWTRIKQFKAHDGELGSARFSPDGNLIVTSGDDRKVKLWDAKSYTLLHTFDGHRHTVWRAIFSPSGEMIASSGYDGEIILWDVSTRTRIRTLKAHKDQVAGLAFTADGSRIVTASDDQTLKFWDLQSGIELFVLRDKGDSAIVHASFSKDGRRLVSGNQYGWITIRSTKDFSEDYKPFLPLDAEESMIHGILEVVRPSADSEVYERELKIAQRVCDYYPSYLSHTIVGISRYRLGHFKQAIVALEEALRIEPIEYGEPDLLPNIEAYLTLALLKNGQVTEAKRIHRLFLEKAERTYWSGDDEIASLQAEIDSAFEALD